MSTFNNNLIRPSSYVGIHPALVAYDVNIDDGMAIGATGVQSNASGLIAGPGQTQFYRWYAGASASSPPPEAPTRWWPPRSSSEGPTSFRRRHQAGAEGARRSAGGGAGRHHLGETDTVPYYQTANASAAMRVTRTSATLNPGTPNPARDFVTVIQKGLGLRYRDGTPVETIAAEGNIAEDAEDSGHMAINYRAEPLWYRFGLRPNAPLVGGDAADAGALGTPFSDVPDALSWPSPTSSPEETRSRRSTPQRPALRSGCTCSCPPAPRGPRPSRSTATSGSGRRTSARDWAKDGLPGKCLATGYFPTLAGEVLVPRHRPEPHR